MPPGRAEQIGLRRRPAAEAGTDPDEALRGWLRSYAKAHPRWGYRRAYLAARAEGWVVNHKKVQRLWRAEGLRVPVRRRRKRVGSSTAAASIAAAAPNTPEFAHAAGCGAWERR